MRDASEVSAGAPKYLVAYLPAGAGLGNRVRVMMGARSLADLEGRRFRCVWPTGKAFGPRFSQLWEADDPPGLPRVVSRALAPLYPYREKDLEWLDDAARRERVWQIRTGGALNLPPAARDWRSEFRSLRPVPEIAAQVTAMHAAQLGSSPYVGVMIRAHEVSHPQTILSSPIDWYLSRMREIRRQDPDVRFYVSCDVPQVQERVIAEIGGCVGQTDKGGYNTIEGVQSSVVDLYLLASSAYLLGPHYSSFVRLAHVLCEEKIPLETSVTDAGATAWVTGTSPSSCVDPLRPSARIVT